MKKALIFSVLFFFMVGCKSKKIKLADDDIVGIEDFVEFFTEISLPFQTADSIFTRAETDSATIGYKIFTQFIPDSVISKQFKPDSKIRIYPLGRVSIKNFETYLFLKVVSPTRKAALVIALNNEKKFVASMPLVVADKDPATTLIATMDKKFTITQTIQKKNSGEDASETKNVYILNAEAGTFSLIMTDQGTPEQEREIINPIDTLPRKNKFSGDYIKDKRNYVSIRDGKKPSNIIFFIHFEKEDGACIGEIKGEASMRGARSALYQAIGNPCVLELTLSGNAVSIKELEACGSYRDIRCFFEGSFIKKKEPRSKSVSKKLK